MHTDATSRTTELQSLSRQEFWHQHVTQWQSSGLSKRTYCDRYELVYHQMVYWCSKHKAINTDEKPIAATGNGFVPVSVAPVCASAQCLSVRLPNGLLIEGIDQHNVALLSQVVRQL